MVLDTLHHHSLFSKEAKCAFCSSSVAFLGHVILAAGLVVYPRTTEAISEWARPSSCTDVRRFVGLANYYCKLVKGFTMVAAPLTELCSPRATFLWDQAKQASFDMLKVALT